MKHFNKPHWGAKGTRVFAILLALTVLILTSLGNVLLKQVYEEVNPFSASWISVFIGMVALNVYTFGVRREPVPRNLSRQTWLYLIVIGVCNYTIYRITRPIALEYLPVVTVTFLGEFVGFMTMGFSIFILKEKPTGVQLIGTIVAILGIVVFFDKIPSNYQFEGILLILVGMVAIGLTNNLIRKMLISPDANMGVGVFTAITITIGGVITTLVGAAIDFPPPVSGINSWLVIGYTGLVQIAFALTLWNYVLKFLRSYEASILGLTSLVWASIFAFIILGETLTIRKVVAILLVAFGVSIIQIYHMRPSPKIATEPINKDAPVSLDDELASHSEI